MPDISTPPNETSSPSTSSEVPGQAPEVHHTVAVKSRNNMLYLVLALVTILVSVGLYLNWQQNNKANEKALPIASPEESISPTTAPGSSLVPQASIPTTTGGLPFGPFHFGERSSDYTFSKDGVVAENVFTGGFVHLGTADSASKVQAAETVLSLARSKGKKLIVSITESYPCKYWDTQTFNGTLLDTDASYLVPTVAKYYPDTIIAVMILNEPHDPQAACHTPIPQQSLYDAAKKIRARFATLGKGTIPLGFGAPATYFDGKMTADGTVTLANSQFSPQRGTIASFISTQEGAAKRMGMKLYLTVNASKTGAQLDDNLVTVCQTADLTTTIMTGYWSWNENGGNQSIPLSDFTKVRSACALR